MKRRSRLNFKVIALALSSFLMAAGMGCSSGSKPNTESSGQASATLQIWPANSTISPNASLQFTGSGGSGNYTYQLQSPSICNINQSSGYLTASSTTGTCTVTITDTSSGATASTTVTISSSGSNGGGTLSLYPTNPSVAPSTSIQFSASGGSGVYQYSVSPSSCTIGTSGLFIASATMGTCTVTVLDTSTSASVSTMVSISSSASSGITVSPINPTVGYGASVTLSAQGGSGSYTYQLISGSGTGSLAGNVYVAPNNATVAVIQATDSSMRTGTTTITVSANGTNPGAGYTYPLSGVVLQSLNSANVVDLKGKSGTYGTPIQQWRWLPTDNANQIWTFQAASNGYTIVSKQTNKCIQLADQSFSIGDLLIEDSCTGALNQVFNIRSIDQVSFEIVHQSSGYCWGIVGASTAQGARIELQECSGVPSQLFHSFVQ